MNSKHVKQIRSATFATVVAFLACASTATPAFAEHIHDDGQGGDGTTAVSPYAVPIEALDGMTLAQYIQKHHADDPRTHVVV